MFNISQTDLLDMSLSYSPEMSQIESLDMSLID